RFIEAVVAAGRGENVRAHGLCEGLVQWAQPRGLQVYLWRASQVRGLVAVGQGNFEEAYQQATMISRPGHLASHAPDALRVLIDVVDAALHTGRDAEAAAHVAAMQEANLAGLSSRLALVVGATAAMTAPDENEALELFRAALALPGIE